MHQKNWFEQFSQNIAAIFTAFFALDFLSDTTGIPEEDIAFFSLMQSNENNQGDQEYDETDDMNYYEPLEENYYDDH